MVLHIIYITYTVYARYLQFDVPEMSIVDVQARVVGACARQNTLQLPFGAHQTVDACGGVRRWTFVTPGDREKKTFLDL